MDQALPEVPEAAQVRDLLAEAYACRISDLGRSIDISKRALAISRKVDDPALIGKSLSNLALFYMIMGEHKRATLLSEEAIGYFRELGDERGIADAKYNIAGIYYKTDNFHLGLVYLIDCLAIYKKFDDYHNQARVQKSLGTIYEYFGDRKNAIKAYKLAVKAGKLAGDVNLESNAYNPLSGVYLKQEKTVKAMDMIEKSIRMKERSGDRRGLAFALYGRAKVYTKLGRFTEAEVDFKEALEIHIEVGERLGTGMAYRKLAVLYMEMGELKKAKKALQKALEVSDAYNIAIVRFKTNYLFYELYRREKNHAKALAYLERYLLQRESVINTQTLKVIENYELITKMESLEKEAEVQKEKAEIIEKKNRAEQAALVRQAFLSTMSHEIRTPLNAVITISSLLRQRSNPEEQQLVDSLSFAANNLLLIVNDILDFSKLDAGKVELEIHPNDFIALLANIKNMYESQAHSKNIALSLRLDSGIASSYELDETKLSQILGNLVSNAIKYTDAGEVMIEVEKTGNVGEHDTLLFKVTDTGSGISEEHHEAIFESFHQPKSITTRKQGGSGLGLAIVKKLAALYNSTVYVKSSPDAGSCFYFELNLKPCQAPQPVPVKRSNRLEDKLVLLAEDNMINALVATKLLSNWGMKAVHAKNGIEAVECARQQVFDFILMDIHMPEMNGFQATRNIRQDQNPNSNTPVYALTADITAMQQDEFVDYFNGFLRKPIEIEKLYAALTSHARTA